MKRRQFITLLDGAATWPLAARAQQGERMRRIGMLIPLNADDKVAQDRIAVFVQGLKELGWIEGRNVQFDIRLGAGVATTLKQATEMVALAPEVILANGSAAMGPLLQVTSIVPIVFVIVPDPVGAGLRRKPGAARRQCHRGSRVNEYGHDCEMAGTTQADCP